MADVPGGTLDLPASDQVARGGDLDPGQVIGHFVIRSRLGEGGMGIVLAAHDPDLDRPVAVKVVKHAVAPPAYRGRLLREAKVMARIEHPNVIRVYEVGTDRERLFIAMELVDGVTLAKWLASERRPWRAIIDMFLQVGRGLAAVHAAGLVHRDFKPDNVLVDRHGRAKVADFGLARLDPEHTTVSPDLAASLTRTGMMVGTPAYMAPEQHFGGDVDARADQYSFCVALREALLGRRVVNIQDADWGAVPRAVRVVVQRGAAVDASERWPSMDALLAALSRATKRRAVVLGVAAAASIVVAAGVIAAVAMTSSREHAAPSSEHAAAPDAAVRVAPAPVVEIDAAIADAAIAITDAAVAVRVAEPVTPRSRAKRTRDDASAPADVGGAVITPLAPVAASPEATERNREPPPTKRHEMTAARRAAVRDTVRELGYGGIRFVGSDRDADARELTAKIAATTGDLERGVLWYALGQVERARGNCGAAAKAWLEARRLVLAGGDINAFTDDEKKIREQAFRTYGRALIAEAYCDLESGRALVVGGKLVKVAAARWALARDEQAQALFAWGIAAVETGDRAAGLDLFQQAIRYGASDKLRKVIETYAAGVGLTL